jgi:hypothetical protein
MLAVGASLEKVNFSKGVRKAEISGMGRIFYIFYSSHPIRTSNVGCDILLHAAPVNTLPVLHCPSVAQAGKLIRFEERGGRRYTWSCYPNPTADVLHVELEGNVQELFVTDAAGKVLLRAAPERHQAALRVDHLPTGIYFLTFFTGLGWEKTRFLVRR